jgi:hypothetical protein
MPTREDFEMALALAREVCRKQNPAQQADRAAVRWIPDHEDGQRKGCSEVPFLGTVYVVKAPEGEVSYKESGVPEKEPALWEKILVLHYCSKADGKPLAKEHMSFQEIADGRLYQPNFEKRVVAPLLGAFGTKPHEVLEFAGSLGGVEADLGDVSVAVPVFPRVPVTLVFWKGDEEFPPRLSILLDKSISHYLPTEDIVLASQMFALRLIGMARGQRR